MISYNNRMSNDLWKKPMKSVARLAGLGFGLFFVILVLAIVGEVMCIVKAVNCDWREPYRAEVIYTASAMTGLGAIVGWIDISDGEVAPTDSTSR